MHSYKPNLVKYIRRQGDAKRRITFISWLITQLKYNLLF